MQIRSTERTLKGPPERFTGDAWFDMIVTGAEPSRIRSSIVHFAPGARNGAEILIRPRRALLHGAVTDPAPSAHAVWLATPFLL
jgi:hypothetical protein